MTDVRLLQAEKALAPIVVTLSGIVTFKRPELKKARSLISVTLSGIVTLVSEEQ
jgi:hypothetical protein